jgi:hypothetical protein
MGTDGFVERSSNGTRNGTGIPVTVPTKIAALPRLTRRTAARDAKANKAGGQK